MKLYHVSRRIDFEPYFEPRIPSVNDESTENQTIPRICFSTSIEGCLSAIPGADEFDILLLEQRGMFRIYEIDTEQYEINKEDLVLTETIDINGWVHDAYVNDECWVMKPLTVRAEDSYVVIVSGYSEESEDCVPWNVRQLAETDGFDGNLEEAYFYLNPDESRLPCVAIVEKLSFISSRSVFPLQFELRLINEHFSEELQEEETSFIRALIAEYYPKDIVLNETDPSTLSVTFNHPDNFTHFCRKHFDYLMSNW